MEKSIGKINHSVFEDFIKNKCGRGRPEVLTGPNFGVDVSVIDLHHGNAMALTSDPLSLIPSLGLQESAWLSVHLMANDMATTGFAPMYGQLVLNLPAYLSKQDFLLYWDYIHQYCQQIGVAITGGHTGFVENQNSTISGGGTFITVAPKDKILVSAHAQAGDSILMTKTAALSSSAILAMSFPETVKQKLGKETYDLACQSFFETSSLKEALTAVQVENTGVTAMHDVTEGGILGAVYEMAIASGNGADIFDEEIPVENIQKEICQLFSLDPKHCIGAGSMIISCKKERVDDLILRLKNENIPCTEIGKFTEKSNGINVIKDGKHENLIYQHEDPYWKAFFKALEKEWK
ncbi:AIR synthase family protein [Chryseobacterium sp.]|uniref:AIR synthase family protein n=1 Tax=Chryseobacterium sp. TaxID=1871047 RepID=UPI00289ECDE7|nr:AIR synthase family protein [Chryseobacterium sp.]